MKTEKHNNNNDDDDDDDNNNHDDDKRQTIERSVSKQMEIIKKEHQYEKD